MQLGRPEPCRPLTRRPGAWAPIPGTFWRVQLFPTQVRLEGPLGQRIVSDLPIQGPVTEWTAQLDLDRYLIRMWGKAEERFSIILQARSGKIEWLSEGRHPQSHQLANHVETFGPTQERLQFGDHSIQDIDRLQALVLSHVVPTWFRLGFPLPEQHVQPNEPSLAGQWAQSMADLDRHRTAQAIVRLRKAGFKDLWSPESQDSGFWGFGMPATTGPAHQLLAAGARLLRDMVVQHNDRELILLPCLPKELPAGRWLHGQWPNVGTVHLEWTRGFPRRLLLEPNAEGTLALRWHGSSASVSPVIDGVPHKRKAVQLLPGQPLEVVAGQPLLIDRFLS
jgi:hypothetical protein